MDFQIVTLVSYFAAVSVAIWYVQFTDCIRRFEQSRMNPVPEAMMQKYHDSKKHDIPTSEEDYDSDTEHAYETMREQLHSYLSRYPRILDRYMAADTEEAREIILDELRHCTSCAADNVGCRHNEGEAEGGVLPEGLPALSLETFTPERD